MTGTAIHSREAPPRSGAGFELTQIKRIWRTVGPLLLFGVRLWASTCLALYVSFWLQLDNAYWAGTSAAIVCQPHVGASLRKGWFRMIGTVIGAVAIVQLTSWFPQNRGLFLAGLAVWGGMCAFTSTILRNFAAYSAALAGYTAVIIAGDQLGAAGGVNGDAFFLGITRASEISIGIVSAGIVLAGTDLGGAPRRLATLLAGVTSAITANFTRTLVAAGSEFADTQPLRRELLGRVIALYPVIDEVLGESSRIRYHSLVLQKAVDGLFDTLAGWRAVACHLLGRRDDRARADAAAVLRCLPPELRSLREPDDPARWTTEPARLYGLCQAAASRLWTLPASTPSLRLLADQTGEVLRGLSHALNGLALLEYDPAQPVQRRGLVQLAVPDWLPPLINAGRAVITIGAVSLFWIVTAWPSGAQAITFSAIVVILFSPQAERSYAIAVQLMMGTVVGLAAAATVNFAVLPGLKTENFAAFAAVLGVYMIPGGAMVAQPWRTPMFIAATVFFVPLLAPANMMNYDPSQLYNAGSGLFAGICAGALSFRLLPALSPAYRTRRLLQLTLRDLRRLARRPTTRRWETRVYARLEALPAQATPLERAQLLAAMTVGTEIVRLRDLMARLGLGALLGPAGAALATGDNAIVAAHLAHLDAALAARVDTAETELQTILRARGSIIVISEALTQHAAYFGAGAAG